MIEDKMSYVLPINILFRAVFYRTDLFYGQIKTNFLQMLTNFATRKHVYSPKNLSSVV